MKKINKDIILNLSIVIISFLATYFLKYVINFEEEITYTNSIVSLIVFVSFIYLLKKTFIRENIEKIKSACFLGIMFSTFLVIGNSIDTNSTVEYGNIQVYLAIIFISFMIDALLVQLYKLIEKFEKRKNKEKISKLSTNKKTTYCIFNNSSLLDTSISSGVSRIFLLWCIWWIFAIPRRKNYNMASTNTCIYIRVYYNAYSKCDIFI